MRAHVQAPVAQVVDGGEGFGRRHGVKVGQHEHAGTDPGRSSGPGDGGQHHQCVVIRPGAEAFGNEQYYLQQCPPVV